MLDEYLAELALLGEFDASYPYFDLYWKEPKRMAYWIEAACKAIGFVFVNQLSFSGLPTDWALAEIYIAPDHRTTGAARKAIGDLFTANPGWWEGCVFNANLISLAFCRAIARDCGAGGYEEIAIPAKTIFRMKIPASENTA